jgi:hypothetical protein
MEFKMTKNIVPVLTKSQKIERLKSKCANSKYIDECIENYQFSTKNAVENLLQMSKTVHSIYKKVIDDELKEFDLLYFCKSVSLDRDSSTFRKFNAIGKNADRFKAYIDKLPSAYTVLYEIATLDAKTFDLMLANNMLNQFITLKEVKRLANKIPSSKASVSDDFFIKIECDVKNSSNASMQLIENFRASLKSCKDLRVEVHNLKVLKNALDIELTV